MKRIVVTGPESTGKSTLCEQLAEHYKTLWVPEYAREYLLSAGMNYSYDDLLHIAKEQCRREDEYAQQASGNDLLVIDTDMYVMKVWCEVVFGKCHQWILDQIVARKYALYLLCSTDLPWTKDELREYPDLESRQRLLYMYKDIMVNQTVPFTIIEGSGEQRLLSAVAKINLLQLYTS